MECGMTSMLVHGGRGATELCTSIVSDVARRGNPPAKQHEPQRDPTPPLASSKDVTEGGGAGQRN